MSTKHTPVKGGFRIVWSVTPPTIRPIYDWIAAIREHQWNGPTFDYGARRAAAIAKIEGGAAILKATEGTP